ncbi:hypothetical protein SCHIN_v1c01170 [Spiroplasma chinense]|uniref:RDD domain-containing protein n=1 Tax=Spiroplasma chinense TaxID=216932 RepID=A0A5B9Y3E8_9MOLU|nr:hypothetical protein [Spiroplasma chinense]QEH61315.1 hypothetical protein SCHIN_v1c01170 [Spiroplasma chinense]
MKAIKIFAAHWLDWILTLLTLGVFGIIQQINTGRGIETFGMRKLGITYSNPDRSGNLYIMNGFAYILWFLTFGVMFIIDLIALFGDNETFGEKWSGNVRNV